MSKFSTDVLEVVGAITLALAALVFVMSVAAFAFGL